MDFNEQNVKQRESSVLSFIEARRSILILSKTFLEIIETQESQWIINEELADKKLHLHRIRDEVTRYDSRKRVFPSQIKYLYIHL